MKKEEQIKIWKKRPMSHSQFSTWEWNKEDWYKRYILNERDKSTPEQIFGKKFAESIEDGTCEVKELLNKLQKKKEHPFNVSFDGIELVGYADAFCDQTFKKLDEVKTGSNEWNKKKVDKHDQITMYLFCNYITNKIKPEDVECNLYWIPTVKIQQENGDLMGEDYRVEFVKPIEIRQFKTSRTMADILRYGAYIKKTREEMEKYAIKHS